MLTLQGSIVHDSQFSLACRDIGEHFFKCGIGQRGEGVGMGGLRQLSGGKNYRFGNG